MILTYKLKHHQDFSLELAKARKVAEYAVDHKRDFKVLTTKYVKQFGLKAAISNQILRKYGRSKTIKSVKRVNLVIPRYHIRLAQDTQQIYIPCLKLTFEYLFPNNFSKVNQIEINKIYIFVSVTVPEQETLTPTNWLGVDLNTTQHVAVAANPNTGKILKLGKSCEHIHKKYKNIRRLLQKHGHYRRVKKIKNRESRIVRNINHHISKKLVQTAKQNNLGIKLENLTGIRNRTKQSKSFRYSLNSWSFYQLKQMIEYKAKLLGVPVEYVAPHYTSKSCSRCGLIGNRQSKTFKCPTCGHVDHADVNAAFNIAFKQTNIGQSITERDVMERSTDTLREAT